MNYVERFEQTYHKSPEYEVFCPYRVCPIGAHSDHNLGKITGLAIDKGIHISFSPKFNGVVELVSLQFDKRAQWHVRSVFETRQGDWADYLRGVTIELGRRFPLTTGVSGVIEGDLPIGGLSSSAAVCISFLQALCKVNSISLSSAEIIEIAMDAENNYVGVFCGKLDQSCEVLSRKDKLLYLDCKTDEYELIEPGQGMKPYDILIFFSGLERTLASGTAFNQRVDEARAAAYALKAFAGIPYGKYAETNLRDISPDVFRELADRLPVNWRKRAEHWYSEFSRVEAGAEAWRRGDIEAYGTLCFESGRSSISNWETGSPELKTLFDIMCVTDGIYGGRFSGAGFKGCCMAIADPSKSEEIIYEVKSKYLSYFPALAAKFKSFICHSSDGVII